MSARRVTRQPVAIRGTSAGTGANLSRGPRPALFGVAHVFGTDGSCPFQAKDGTDVFVQIASGAFNTSLQAVREYKQPGILLLIDHDYKQALCGTSDGSLIVWADQKAVRFQVNPNTPNGRRAIEAARARPDLRELSIGAVSILGSRFDRPGQHPLVLANACTLKEISLCSVGRARYPQTRAFVARDASSSRPSHSPRPSHMNSRDPSPEDRALVRILAAESGRIETSVMDDGTVHALIAAGLVTAGRGLRLTKAGRARALTLPGASQFRTAARSPLILT
ncbi:HK97 family phage prohead protease [Gemmata sp. G18]|uniref:HK97 family phage prohead protease n=1 Tax=Gemmata palustris TaxID=2822762 RepID=A0ABS5BSJ4_9BACT|nr:HK97 family phage prohead protease [Gemmata palustris]MBP3956699.1 HK97 family phage prohead protease [Gemmata palustris]